MTISSFTARKALRPPRCTDYSCISRALVSKVEDRLCDRFDVRFKNKAGVSLCGAHFIPRNCSISAPTVVFLHGYISNYSHASFLLYHTVPANMCLFAFDFSGCGSSEGNLVTLGCKESDDIESAVRYLESRKVESVILWGFSMGASAALLFAARNPGSLSLKGMVLDAPYSSILKALSGAMNAKLHLPRMVSEALSHIVVFCIQKKFCDASFIDANPLAAICEISDSVPALFIHGAKDKIVPLSDAVSMFRKFPNVEKSMIICSDDNHTYCHDTSVVKMAFSFISSFCSFSVK